MKAKRKKKLKSEFGFEKGGFVVVSTRVSEVGTAVLGVLFVVKVVKFWLMQQSIWKVEAPEFVAIAAVATKRVEKM
jgi:hypothetical protein